MTSERPVRLLIAEDDYLVREELKRSLKKIACELVGEANNGEVALQMVQELKPDIVLMDIKMPKMDGLEAAALIQEKCPTPVIILTAYETQALVEKSSEAGVAAYLTKPPDASEIRRAITIALARHDDLMKIRKLVWELQESQAEVKTLRGILPICSYCKNIRNDEGYYERVETYLHKHSGVHFSHTICPSCLKNNFPEEYDDLYGEKKE